MNNLSSYCGLIDAKIRASDKDLPVSQAKMEAQMQRLLQKSVEITVNVEESRVPDFQKYAEEFGVLQLSVSKPLKFEDLGLVAIENGYFQCLACSKTYNRKHNAVAHFKKAHTDRPVESKVQCPRCNDQFAKSALNSHMERRHQLKNFNQLLKRSYLPDTSENSVAERKIPKNTLENNPLASSYLRFQQQRQLQDIYNTGRFNSESNHLPQLELTTSKVN